MRARLTAARSSSPVSGWRRSGLLVAAACLLALLGALAMKRAGSPLSKLPTPPRLVAPAAVQRVAAQSVTLGPTPPSVALPLPVGDAPVAKDSPHMASAALGAPLQSHDESPPVAAIAPPSSTAALPSQPHRVPFALLAAWSKPGLCSASTDATSVRARLTADFRIVEPDEGGKVYLDPRLPAGAEQPILADLRQAEAETAKRLGLRPARPLLFVYADQPLMKAAACINENVVAFYDGALHVVANRTDLRQSLVHEFTHHALFSSGFITPAWAQEGIAMSIAQERWWREQRYLQALVASPFSVEQMDRSIPYKLPSEQAVMFYVQSAVLVECLLEARKWTAADLLAALRQGASADALSYDLPELDQDGFLVGCLQGSRR